MMIVAISLAALAVIVSVVAVVMVRLERKSAIPVSEGETLAAAPPPAPSAPVDLHPDGVPPEVRAAIAAAVLFTLKTPHRILEVHRSNPMLQAWSVEGRRSIFQSHRVR